ncbi:hypothetical protein [Methylobacterium dankookense]|uniref:Uncharacterized protein n=1 Tax=Methylobacterium dankookense TaxID=560405 RepID=A0A564FWB6_9HYPH|nr:hypothetical protein [Methylobacterium dankookense]GJD58458.1 hypothetical protein IFDJLNFL_4379 [Methylobacterium dankookense]VUF12297.1 hypothetical protein MTDSW087_01986 [Methylobacterium dankookense]
MVGYLTRCGTCRQPILSDARCCPHCAVAKPARGRKVRNALLAALALGAAVLGAYSIRVSVPDLFARAPPDRFAVACAEKGGTVVQMRNAQGAAIQRCALSFDDDVAK